MLWWGWQGSPFWIRKWGWIAPQGSCPCILEQWVGRGGSIIHLKVLMIRRSRRRKKIDSGLLLFILTNIAQTSETSKTITLDTANYTHNESRNHNSLQSVLLDVGCGKAFSIDRNWKLCYLACMYHQEYIHLVPRSQGHVRIWRKIEPCWYMPKWSTPWRGLLCSSL